MSEWSIVRVVAERNITQRLRSRAFLITTALVCVLIVGLGLLQQVLSDTSTPRFDVAVAGPVPSEFTTTLAAAADAASVEVVATVVPDRAAAEAGVVDGRFDAAIDVGTDELLWSGGTDAQLSGVLDTAWRIARSLDAAGAAGLDPVELAQVLNPAPLASVVLDPVDEVDATGQAVGWLTAVLLFFSITFFGGFILMGVVEEKSSAGSAAV